MHRRGQADCRADGSGLRHRRSPSLGPLRAAGG